MTDITYTYCLSQLESGKPPAFVNSGPGVLHESLPDHDRQLRYKPSALVETVADSTTGMKDASTNTFHKPLVPRGMSHTAGGWPLSVDPNESESKWKFTEKAERDESFISSVVTLGAGVTATLRANNTLDLYEKYSFEGAAAEAYNYREAVPSLKLSNVLTGGSGEVVGASWSPFSSFRLAVAHSDPRGTQPGLVWDMNEPETPVSRLVPNKDCLTAIAYSVKDMNIIAGGSSTGTLYLWDTRAGTGATDHSSVENSHRESIYAMRWMTAKSGEALTASLDGTVRLWDMRNLNTPVANNVLSLHRDGASWGMMDELFGGVSLDYDPLVGGPTSFLVGTQEGMILDCERGEGNMQVVDMYSAHHGPVYAAQRCFSHPSVMLSAGDWRCCLWFDSCPTPLWSTPYTDTYVTSALWQHKRSSLFFRSLMNGCIEAWDMVSKQGAPTVQYRLSKYALTHLALHAEGEFLAVGDASGSVHIVGLAGTLIEDRPEYHSWLDLVVKEGGRLTRQLSPIQMPSTMQRAPSMFLFTPRTGGAAGGLPPRTSSTTRNSQFRGFHKKQSTMRQNAEQEQVVSKPSDDVLETYLSQVKQSMAEASTLSALPQNPNDI